jgi:hypothetical protein
MESTCFSPSKAAALLLLLYCCCFTAASLPLLLYRCCFTAAALLLLLYCCCFTAALLLLYYRMQERRGSAGALQCGLQWRRWMRRLSKNTRRVTYADVC